MRIDTTRPRRPRPGPSPTRLHLGLGALAATLLTVTPFSLAAQDRTPPPPPVVGVAGSTGWVGINVRVTEKPGEPPLVVIDDVWPGSPAEQAGIQPGDRVLRVNGAEISPRQFRSLSQRLQPGDPMMLVVERDGTRLDLTVVSAPRPGRVTVAPQRLRTELESVRGRMARILARGEADLADSVASRISMEFESTNPRIVVEVEEGDSTRTRVIRLDSLASVNATVVGIRGLDDQGFVFLSPERRALSPAPPVPDEPRETAKISPGRLPFPFTVGLNRVAGAEFRLMNAGLARYFEADTGLLVTAVAEGTPAEESGLRSGDVLVEANGEPLTSVAGLRRALTIRPDTAVLTVVRRGERLELRLR